MEIFEQFGITQQILEGVIIFGVAAILVAIYWRLLAIGAAILFCAFVFAHHRPADKPQEVVTPTAVENKPEVVTQSQQDLWHKQFMEDCLSVSQNDKNQCEIIWQERVYDEQHPEKTAVKMKMWMKAKARKV
jgi:hypothetical protein